jgi:hypothetical protein
MRKLFNVIAGFVVPIRITSRLYLADRLAHYGVDIKRLPESCLQELADDIVRTTRSVAALSRKGWREIVTDHLEGAAVSIARLLLGEPLLNSPFTEYIDHFAKIIRKHGVFVPL